MPANYTTTTATKQSDLISAPLRRADSVNSQHTTKGATSATTRTRTTTTTTTTTITVPATALTTSTSTSTSTSTASTLALESLTILSSGRGSCIVENYDRHTPSSKAATTTSLHKYCGGHNANTNTTTTTTTATTTIIENRGGVVALPDLIEIVASGGRRQAEKTETETELAYIDDVDDDDDDDVNVDDDDVDDYNDDDDDDANAAMDETDYMRSISLSAMLPPAAAIDVDACCYCCGSYHCHDNQHFDYTMALSTLASPIAIASTAAAASSTAASISAAAAAAAASTLATTAASTSASTSCDNRTIDAEDAGSEYSSAGSTPSVSTTTSPLSTPTRIIPHSVAKTTAAAAAAAATIDVGTAASAPPTATIIASTTTATTSTSTSTSVSTSASTSALTSAPTITLTDDESQQQQQHQHQQHRHSNHSHSQTHPHLPLHLHQQQQQQQQQHQQQHQGQRNSNHQHHHLHHHHHNNANNIAGCKKVQKFDPRLGPSPYRQLLPIVICILLFAAVFSVLIVYMDTTEIRHQQFRLNMSKDYELFGVSQDEPTLVAFLREIHMKKYSMHFLKNRDSSNPQQYLNLSEYHQVTTEMALYVAELVGSKLNGAVIQSLPGEMGQLMTAPWLAATLDWAGVIVEPEPRRYFTLSKQNALHTKMQVVHACVSPNAHPKEITIQNEDAEVRINSLLDEETSWFNSRVKCFPLYTIMLACNRSEYDLLSLGVHTHDLEILQTLPFDKVKIEIISIHLPDTYDNVHDYVQAVTKFLKGKSYKLQKSFGRNYFYQKINSTTSRTRKRDAIVLWKQP